MKMFRILMVDDTRSVHTLIKSFVENLSQIQISSAFQGDAALEILKADNSFDLILLDWEMPVLNGPDTLRVIRDLGISIPVIMVTTKNKPEDLMLALELGAAEYLMKPFSKEILLEKLEMVSGRSFTNAA